MIDALKFVLPAVDSAGVHVAFKHVRIQNRTVRAFNGTLALCSPIPCDLDLTPNATQLLKALQTCKDTPQLTADNGRLVVKSGKFRAVVDCLPDGFPDVFPSGQPWPAGELLMAALRTVRPFMGQDPNRPWACGVCLRDGSAYATDNRSLIEYWTGFTGMPTINLPSGAVVELLKIEDPPTRMLIDEHRVSFTWKGGRWMASQLLQASWPVVAHLLDGDSRQVTPTPAFFDALETLLPFCDEMGRVYFHGTLMATTLEPELTGARVKVAGLPERGCFNGRMLLNLKGVADTVDLAAFPAPSKFFGNNCRGVVCGFSG